MRLTSAHLVLVCANLLIFFCLFGSSAGTPLSSVSTYHNLVGSAEHLWKRYSGNISPKDEDQPGPDTSDYPSDEVITAAITARPDQTDYVFWSEIMGDGSALAQNFAREIGGVTVYDVWPDGWVCQNGRSDAWWISYIDRVSGIFGDHASGTVYLVTDSMTGLTRDCSVFLRVEAPTLIGRGYTHITFVNAHDFSDRRVRTLYNVNDRDRELNVLRLPGQTPNNATNGANGTYVQAKSLMRRAPAEACLNWEGYGDDPNGPCQVKNPGKPYAKGQCGVHITQHRQVFQYPYPDMKPLWPLDIQVKDANTEVIGSIGLDITANTTFSLPSKLPFTFEITPGRQKFSDSSPLFLAYAGWSTFTDVKSACSVGAYDGGRRQMDCGFPCN